MKKKIISMCAALALAAGTVPAMAADIPDKVEITFKVGDSVLTVNGKPLEVTAPYVVGDGTTLVPVRVITEAFGAEVNWDGATQSVNLKYPDVDITIKIGSKSAQVNTHTEELLAAPELYQDTTMVPLRFISETFGAKVEYNDGLITVTKEAAKETSSTVVGMSDKEFIGDSFHGWTMKNPKMLQMEDRSFDGTHTIFTDDEKGDGILLLIEEQKEDYDIDTEFNKIRNALSNETISIADKEQMSDGYTKIHFRAKNSEQTVDYYEYIKGNKKYSANVNADNDSSILKELFDIAESFSLSESRDYHDLSNAVNGIRLFSDETYGVSLNIPANWTQSTITQPNVFAFYDPDKANQGANIEISSKSDTVSAQKLAESDREVRASVVNPDLVTVSEVGSDFLSGVNSCYYTVNYNGFGDSKHYTKDSFIEVGDYVINIAVYAEDSKTVSGILDTFKASAPDSEKVGNIIRSSDLGGTSKLTVLNGKVTVPEGWNQQISGLPLLHNDRTGANITVSTINNVPSNASTKDVFQKVADSMEKDGENLSKHGKMKTENNNGHTFYIQEFEETKDNVCSYYTYYVTEIKGQTYIFQYHRKDIYYSGSVDKEAEEIILGFTVE